MVDIQPEGGGFSTTNFERINRRHTWYLKILGEWPGGALCNLKSAICNPAQRGGRRRSARRCWRW
jgi:hypothetical protein